ncbi:MAG TPA: bifunctional diguanylate cyclase/phosphodiesterase [Trueperaceae bacterium]|nr:bifunctional diguanylate cyclase/phosphodiesterase [Trueperaceae bacterium]
MSDGRATEHFFHSHPQPSFLYDPRTLEFLAVNPAATVVFGLSPEGVAAMGVLELHPAHARSGLRQQYGSATTPHLITGSSWPHGLGGPGDGAVAMRGPLGEFDAAISVFELTYAGRSARLAIVADLSAHLRGKADTDERLALAQRAEYLAYNDPVTDLPNRQRFESLLLDTMADASASGTRVAVLYLELHGFRLIHDAISQEAADDMLRLAARRLKTVSHGSTVARFGSDEFAILTRPLHAAIEATDIAQRVVGVLVEPLTLEGRSVTFRPRVGVAVFPDHATKPGDLMKAASQAKYRAKASRGPAFAVFRPAMQVRATERLALEGELRLALGAGQLVIYYQPRLDLRDASLAGVEALVRWRHPERGLLSPDSFVPLAEETGLIGALGQEVLERALEQLRLWQESGFMVPRVAVNLSPLELRGGGLVDRVRSALNRARLPASRLELEVTETAALVDRNRGSELLAELRARGVTITLDDFGTGYATLAHLRQLPIDAIKLDRAFLDKDAKLTAGGATRDLADSAILTAVAALGRAIGVAVTAEGVETEVHLADISEAGCDFVQGYLISRPVGPASVQDAVRTGSQTLERLALAHAKVGAGNGHTARS